MDDERTGVPEEGEAASDSRNLPVLASEARPIEPVPEAPLAVPAVAAAGGFLAGLVTFVIVRALRATR